VPDTPQTLSDGLAQWARDTLAHQEACLALQGNQGLCPTTLPACQAWVERICKALLSRARAPLSGGDRAVLLLGVQDLADCPDDLLPSLTRLQELSDLDLLGGVRLALPGMVSTRIALYRRHTLATPKDEVSQPASTTPGEHTPLLSVARGGGASDRCVVS
jgi:hypothetical protein